MVRKNWCLSKDPARLRTLCSASRSERTCGFEWAESPWSLKAHSKIWDTSSCSPSRSPQSENRKRSQGFPVVPWNVLVLVAWKLRGEVETWCKWCCLQEAKCYSDYWYHGHDFMGQWNCCFNLLNYFFFHHNGLHLRRGRSLMQGMLPGRSNVG